MLMFFRLTLNSTILDRDRTGSIGIPVKDRIFSTLQKKGKSLFRNSPITVNRLTFKSDFFP